MSNKYLEIRYGINADTGEHTGSYSNVLFGGENPDTVVIRMKVRIDEDAYFYANDRAYMLRFLRRKADGSGAQEAIRFAKLSSQSISVEGVIEGDQIPDITQWTDVELVLNARSGVGIYRIGGAEGTFTFEPSELTGIQFTANATATGLYIDDLLVMDKAPETVLKTYTASVTWDDAHDYAGIRPESVDLTLGGKTATVNEACNWKADFTLPAFNADGSEILYELSADADQYTPQLSQNGLSAVLSHEPVLHATDREDDCPVAYFYNDFEGYYDNDGNVLKDPLNHFYSGATVRQLDTPMTLQYAGGNNSYLRIFNKLATSASNYQADFVNYAGGDYTVHFKLSTDTDLAPKNVTLQYRNRENDTTDAKNVILLKAVSKNNKIYLYAIDKENNTYELAQIAKDTWVSVHAVFRFSADGQSDACDFYIDGVYVATAALPARLSTFYTTYIRLALSQEATNAGRSLLLDDFIVYPGTDILSATDVKSPGYYFYETGLEVEDAIGVEKWDETKVTVDPDVLKEAVNTPDITWPDTRAKTYEAMNSALALYHMVLSVHMDEDVTVDGQPVAVEAASRIKLLVSGGREPWASIGCHWGHGVVATTMALAKNTPAIWNQLSADDISRVNLLMECLAIAANWGYNADNSYLTGFDLSGDFSRDGANFINAYLTCYMSAAMYFDDDRDGGDELDAIFTSFNYDSYIARLNEYGFTNILFTWTTVEEGTNKSIGEYMTNGGTVTVNKVSLSENLLPGTQAGSGVGVAVPFKYRSPKDTSAIYYSNQLTDIFIDTIKYTYSWAVTSSHNTPDDFGTESSKVYAYLISDEINPRLGQMGMMREYASYQRSRSTYCYLSAVNIAPLYANMKLLGYWDYSNEDLMRQMDNRIYVGTEDLFWKMDQGYYSVSTTGTGPEYWSGFATSMGGIFIKDIFWNFHFAKSANIEWVPTEPVSVLEEPAPVDEDYTGPADDAIYAQGNYMSGYNVENHYVYLFEDKSASSNVNVSFDLVVNNNLIPGSFKAIIMLDKAGSNRTSDNAPVALYLHDGLIRATYKHGFWSTFTRFGENYRYHVDIEVDCINQVYNISIQQIWPTVDSESNVVFYRQNFASNYYAAETTEIDSLIVVSSYLQRCVWIENLVAEKVDIITEQ